MKLPRIQGTQEQGFTLIELIIVIVITAIIAVGSTQFIVNSAQGLQDVSRRATLASTLTTSIAKIEGHLQSSLSGSIRIKGGASGQCLEMVPVHASAFYLQAPINRASDQLSIIAPARKIVGMKAYIATDQHLSIYDQLTSTSTALSGVVSAQQKTDNIDIQQITLAKAHRFAGNSRQHVVRFVHRALSYCIEGDKLFRYSHYALQKRQPLPINLPKKEPKRVLVSQGLLAASKFSFDHDKLHVSLHLSAGDKQEQLLINQLVRLER